jgi:branched-subunit amino acid aminotransferase/4-amino-4-deoxychorismate lyase
MSPRYEGKPIADVADVLLGGQIRFGGHGFRRAARQSSLPSVVRVTVFAPDLDLGRPGAHLQPHVLVTTRAAPSGRASALRLTCVRYQRDLAEVKHVGLFSTVYHRRVAQLAGSDDVLFLDDTGRVVEGATWNIGFFDGQQVVWPRSACLPGVTMRLLKQALLDSGVPWVEAPVDLYAVAGMQAAFVTNAAVGVRAVRSIDHVGFQADVPIVGLLQQRYLDVTEEET